MAVPLFDFQLNCVSLVRFEEVIWLKIWFGGGSVLLAVDINQDHLWFNNFALALFSIMQTLRGSVLLDW